MISGGKLEAFPTLLDLFVLGGIGFLALLVFDKTRDMECWLCGHCNRVMGRLEECRRCGIENVVIRNQLRGTYPPVIIPDF